MNDTVSLKEIKEAIQNKINEQQKCSLIKNVLINISIAFIMIMYLILIIMGTKNIEMLILEKDIKIITICILAIGIYIMELAYKKDDSNLAINSLEVLCFSGANLCLVYVQKLYFDNLIQIITYIGIVISSYYIIKSIALAIINVRKYKKDNNDIKEIVKK